MSTSKVKQPKCGTLLLSVAVIAVCIGFFAAQVKNNNDELGRTSISELSQLSESRIQSAYPDIAVEKLTASEAEGLMKNQEPLIEPTPLIDLGVDLSRIVVDNLSEEKATLEQLRLEYFNQMERNVVLSNDLELSRDEIAVELFRSSFLIYAFQDGSAGAEIANDYHQIMKGLIRGDRTAIEENRKQIIDKIAEVNNK